MRRRTEQIEVSRVHLSAGWNSHERVHALSHHGAPPHLRQPKHDRDGRHLHRQGRYADTCLVQVHKSTHTHTHGSR